MRHFRNDSHAVSEWRTFYLQLSATHPYVEVTA